MESVSKYFKEEDDFLYERGQIKTKDDVIESMITLLGLSDEQIAKTVKVSDDFVKNIRAKLSK